MAGQRSGLAGDRGALWWEFHRLIDEGRPRWVVGENVPGLLSSRGGADFATIIDSLTELGYSVAWRVLDAQYFGVAQRRRRVFIVGHLGSGSPSEVLALAEGLSGHPKPERAAGKEVAERATGGTRVGSGEGLSADRGLVRALTTRYGTTGADLTDAEGGHVFAIQGTTIGRADTSGPDGKGWNDDGSMYTLETIAPHGVALSPDVIPFAQNTRDEVRIIDEENGAQIVGALAAEPGMKQQTYLMRQREGKPGGGKGPLLSEDKSLTLAANVNDQVLFDGTHNMQVRRLTPVECERLQGFPDDWTSSQSDTQRYRQCGNAVAVPVVEWIMKRLVAVENGDI